VIVTHVTVRVRETWKGREETTFSFMQFGDASSSSRPAQSGERIRSPRIPGLPTYRVGEEVLLLLYPASDAGLTSPVGGMAGKIPIRRDPKAGTPSIGEATLERGVAAGGSPEISLERARARVAASLRDEALKP
jgi:hypothetical protein